MGLDYHGGHPPANNWLFSPFVIAANRAKRDHSSARVDPRSFSIQKWLLRSIPVVGVDLPLVAKDFVAGERAREENSSLEMAQRVKR